MSEVAILKQTSTAVFSNVDSFEQAQRMIQPLMQSTMVPEAYRGNAANCMVAMEMSHRIGKSVLEVMQNMQVVKGTAGWKSEYVIMSINRSGIFEEPLDFIFSDDRQSCYAVATRKSNKKELRGTLISMKLAEAEGWLNKPGSKWKTMPEQMLMYRAATFFCRVYCPEVLAGIQTTDEITDIGHMEVTQSKAINDINSKIAPEATETAYEYHETEEIEDEFQDETDPNGIDVVEAETVGEGHPQEEQEEDDDF